MSPSGQLSSRDDCSNESSPHCSCDARAVAFQVCAKGGPLQNLVRLQLHALAYNLCDFLRGLATPFTGTNGDFAHGALVFDMAYSVVVPSFGPSTLAVANRCE